MKKAALILASVGALIAAGSAMGADGKAVYDKSCKACHANMAPKTGDKAAWAPRIQMGADALVASVMKGKGMMKPKGGAASEEDVKAAVDYIISQSQ